MDDYYKCLKCHVLIPFCYHHLHLQECHKRRSCLRTHPFIEGSCMLARLCVIEKCKSNSSLLIQSPIKIEKGVRKWPVLEESDSIARLNCSFSHGFALLNNVDLLQLEIEAFTCVFLNVGQNKSIFIPVPCDKVNIGSIGLYEEGIFKKLGISEEITFISVSKIENPKLAREIIVKPLTSIDNEIMEHAFRKKFINECSFGLHCIVRSHGTLQLENMENSTINVEYTVEENIEDVDDPKLAKTCMSSSKDDTSLSSSMNDTSLSVSSLTAVSDLTESFSSLKISKKRSRTKAKESSFKSSTPIKPRSEVGSSPSPLSVTLNSPLTSLNPDQPSSISTPCGTSMTSYSFQSTQDETNTSFSPLHNQPSITPSSKQSTSAVNSKSFDRRRGKQKNNKGCVTSHIDESIESSSKFFRVTQDTRIIVVSDEIPKEHGSRTFYGQYFKTEAYYEVMKLIEKKLSVCDNANLLKILWTGILLTGLPGTGKTSLVQQISTEMNLPLVSVNLLGWSEDSFSENYFEDRFNLAKQLAPSILLLDELDSLCNLESGTGGSMQRSNGISRMIKAMESLSKPVMLIGTTNQPDLLPDRLRKVDRFDRQVIIPLPEPDVRFNILWQILQNSSHIITEENARKLAYEAAGFSGADIESAVRIAWQKAVTRIKHFGVDGSLKKAEFCLADSDLKAGVESVVPYFLRQSYSTVSKVNWADIFGYEDVKEKFKRVLMYQCDSDEELKGVLLYGPPGCSKTMLVRALATETKFTFFPVKCSNLLSKYVGETEKLLGKVFEKASYSCPSLIFMDEIDSLCGERSTKGDTANIVPELLSLLKNSSKKNRILVVGATNRPQAVDEALFSPGCLELLLHVNLPDCSSRCSIWEGLLKNVPKTQIDISLLCSLTEGFSCAEISGIYQKSTHDLLDILHSESASVEELVITQELLLDTISISVRRIPKSLLNSIETFKNSFKKLSI